ncbi:hypothetical protein [Salipiger sp.]|uniref:hypothetical protein n=1 Tax=Salipiger sp. TaxID=2078585 RepID=UPI003A986CF8
MTQYQYKVVPAPAKGEKAPGVKAAEDRFARAIERLMNEMAADGWEFQRAELLPSEERSGLTSSQTVWRNLLVFRRPAAVSTIEATEAEPTLTPAAAAAPEDEVDLEGRRLTSAADLAAPDRAEETADGGAQEDTDTPKPAVREDDDKT